MKIDCRRDNEKLNNDCDFKKDDRICKITKKKDKFDIGDIIPLVNNPKFICARCGRLANRKENLCKPRGI